MIKYLKKFHNLKNWVDLKKNIFSLTEAEKFSDFWKFWYQNVGLNKNFGITNMTRFLKITLKNCTKPKVGIFEALPGIKVIVQTKTGAIWVLLRLEKMHIGKHTNF